MNKKRNGKAPAENGNRPEAAGPEEIHVLIGQRIREVRRSRRMSLAEVGGKELSRSFLSLVELGHSRISLRALAIVARRLQLPISYFFEPDLPDPKAYAATAADPVEAALAYSYLLRKRGKVELALEYALWAAEKGGR